ncbi:MAG: UDP-N-acetylglucosamine--N-acetylmuramyl-(pentapeptide) pyrophosphoryl-undecaprenol N-acetylglucosamine transferase, partial [Pseudomonadota bacterium]
MAPVTAKRLVIAAGGTGGHMFPAQALAQEMLRRGWAVTLSTDARGARYAGGFPEAVERQVLRAATFSRGGLAARAAAPLAIAAGIASALAGFAMRRPSAVAGFGGYPSLPALSAATLLGVPRLIHEQNGVLGRVNRVFAGRVQALAMGVPLGAPPANAHDIGNPLRDAARAAMATPYAPPGDGALALLVFGGSQGASAFSRLVPAAVADLPDALRARLIVAQQAREGEAEAVRAAYAAAGVRAEVAPFFDDLPARLASAQLVVCRSGASTCAELAALGRPAILIPFPAALDDHQTANARALVEAGGALATPEAGLTSAALSAQMRAVLGDAPRAASMAAAARALGRPDAAGALADL